MFHAVCHFLSQNKHLSSLYFLSLSLSPFLLLFPCVTCPVSITEAASWKTICFMYLFSPLCGCLTRALTRYVSVCPCVRERQRKTVKLNWGGIKICPEFFTRQLYSVLQRSIWLRECVCLCLCIKQKRFASV